MWNCAWNRSCSWPFQLSFLPMTLVSRVTLLFLSRDLLPLFSNADSRKIFGVRKWIKVLAMALNQFIFSSEFRLNLRLQLFAGGFSIIDKWFTWQVFWTSEQFGKLQIDLNLSLAVYSENLFDEVKILTRYLTNRCGKSHQRLFSNDKLPKSNFAAPLRKLDGGKACLRKQKWGFKLIFFPCLCNKITKIMEMFRRGKVAE